MISKFLVSCVESNVSVSTSLLKSNNQVKFRETDYRLGWFVYWVFYKLENNKQDISVFP